GLAPLADNIKRIPSEDTQGFIERGVLDLIFADKLESAVGITPVKPHTAFRERNAEIVDFGIVDFLHDPDIGIHFGAVLTVLANLFISPVLVLLRELGSVVYKNPLCLNV